MAEETERLVAGFRRIQAEQMHDFALLNPRLCVEAVGFREWQDRLVGMLIAPWFISLILLPGEDDDWRAFRVGSKLVHDFPSGSYEFIVCDERTIGRFQSCSLFSPATEFADQAAAVAMAHEFMRLLFDRPARQLQDREDAVTLIEALAMNAAAGIERNMGKPLSRRDVLAGSFVRVNE